MEMSVDKMVIKNMMVNICDNDSSEVAQIIPSGDYNIFVLEDQSLAMTVNVNGFDVELFTYAGGVQDQRWHFQGNGNANTLFTITTSNGEQYLSFDGNDVILEYENVTPWNMVIAAKDGDDYVVYMRLAYDITQYIGVDTVESGSKCKLYPREDALLFRLRRID